MSEICLSKPVLGILTEFRKNHLIPQQIMLQKLPITRTTFFPVDNVTLIQAKFRFLKGVSDKFFQSPDEKLYDLTLVYALYPLDQ